jgi:RHS repeat-associated protein
MHSRTNSRNYRNLDSRPRLNHARYDATDRQTRREYTNDAPVTITYDATDRQTRREYTNDAPVTITYDDVDNPTLIQDGIGRWTMTYDSLNRVQVATDPMGNRNTYTFDAAGQRTAMATAAGRFTYTHDAASRLATIHNPEGERTTYTYDAAGREVLKQFNTGSVASTVYDAAGQVIALYNKTSGGAAIWNLDYTYDAAGNRTQVSETGSRIATWTYDAANRLITERRSGSPAYANTFVYDSAGNRTLEQKDGTRTTFAYDLADQLTTSVVNTSTTTYTFDGAGNLTLQVAPTNNPTTYTWNDDNRQTRVQTPGGVDLTAEYRYDGLRYEKENGGTTTRFVFDGQNYLLETNAAGVIQAAYTVEPRTYGNVVSQRASGATRYFHLDALGSTRVLTNSSQTLTDLYLYDAWGVPLVTIGAATNPFRWIGGVGYYLDVETGLYYVRARIYQPGIARWMSQDPLFYPYTATTGLPPDSLYSYVAARPAIDVDPSGLIRHHWFMKYWRAGTGQAKVTEKCPCPIVNIDDYTTEYTVAESRWIHGRHGGEVSVNYQGLYEGILASSEGCCELLQRMLGFMLAWEHLVSRAYDEGDLGGQRLTQQFDLINYYTRRNPPTSNMTKYMNRVSIYCGRNHDDDVVREQLRITVDTITGFEGWDATTMQKIAEIVTTWGLASFTPIPSPAPCCAPVLAQ